MGFSSAQTIFLPPPLYLNLFSEVTFIFWGPQPGQGYRGCSWHCLLRITVSTARGTSLGGGCLWKWPLPSPSPVHPVRPLHGSWVAAIRAEPCPWTVQSAFLPLPQPWLLPAHLVVSPNPSAIISSSLFSCRLEWSCSPSPGTFSESSSLNQIHCAMDPSISSYAKPSEKGLFPGWKSWHTPQVDDLR